MNRWIRWLAAFGTAFALAACGGGDDDENHGPTQNIVQIAQGDERFSVLVEAVVAADLVATLSGPGPFTVFAPTNDAFTALLAQLGLTKDQLLADKALLTTVLKYHVLDAEVKAAAVPLGKAITPLDGGIFKIDAGTGGALTITDGRNGTAAIVATDIAATNGVIHVIDSVLLPADKDIVATAQANPDFSILVEAVVAAGLADDLQAAGPFTVFAPTNAAFADLLAFLGVTKDQLLADTALLTRVLTYHVVADRVLKADVPVGQPIASLETGTFTVDGSLAITDERGRKATIVATDVLTSNGVIHVIDQVILPAP